jgi:hypothetical protein
MKENLKPTMDHTAGINNETKIKVINSKYLVFEQQ